MLMLTKHKLLEAANLVGVDSGKIIEDRVDLLMLVRETVARSLVYEWPGDDFARMRNCVTQV